MWQAWLFFAFHQGLRHFSTTKRLLILNLEVAVGSRQKVLLSHPLYFMLFSNSEFGWLIKPHKPIHAKEHRKNVTRWNQPTCPGRDGISFNPFATKLGDSALHGGWVGVGGGRGFDFALKFNG